MRKKRSDATVKIQNLLHRMIQARNLIFRYGPDEFNGYFDFDRITSTAQRVRAEELFNGVRDTIVEMNSGTDRKIAYLYLFILTSKLKFKTYNRVWCDLIDQMQNYVRDPSTNLAQFGNNVMIFEDILDCRDVNERVQRFMLLKLSL